MPASVEGALGVAADDRLRVVVATRVGCHLCDEAVATVAAVCEPGTWASVDVDAHPEVRARFTDHVPVVWVDRRLLTYWTLVRDDLVRALDTGDWPSPPHL